MPEGRSPEDELPPNLLAGWYGARVVATGKWVPAVLYALSRNGPLHYQDLSRAVSANVAGNGWSHSHQRLHDSSLAATLRRLVEHGLVRRDEDATEGFASSVRYQLTDAGVDLVRATHALALWSDRYTEIVARAQMSRGRRSPGQ